MKIGIGSTTYHHVVRYAVGALAALAVTACGGGGGSPGAVQGGSGSVTAGSVSLIVSSPDLKSQGGAGNEVTVTALVKTKDNNALADVPVKFTADSGALVVVDAVSDKNGQAKALLSTAGDRTNRVIKVTAQITGVSPATTLVNVVGTTVTVVGPNAITGGGTGDFTITVKDSAGAGIPNVPVTYASQKGNPASVKSSGGGTSAAPLTNSQGVVVLSLTAAQGGTDVLSVASQGANSSSAFSATTSKLTVRTVDANGNTVSEANTSTSCQRIAVSYEVNSAPQSGNVNIVTSRGRLYSDATCAALLTGSNVAVNNGNSVPVYVKSDTAGVSTISASIVGGPSAQTNVEFVAALTQNATISLQTEPAVIGVNTGTGQSESSAITAVVRDGTTNNNLVKNAVVEFSLVSDKSGGRLAGPSSVTTASNGSASTTFIAGTADTEANGVVVEAKIQGTTIATTTTLTVSRRSLFVRAGTGNLLEVPSPTTYKKDFVVFVTDASGNAVKDAVITAAAIPTRYRKGSYTFRPANPDLGTTAGWEPVVVDECANEDLNQNGILDAGEDFNLSGTLEPGIPLSVTSTGTTDAAGTAVVSVLYPKDRGNWTDVKMTIRGSVSGTESTYITNFKLSVLASDLANAQVSPPGSISPYGVNPCNIRD